MVPVFFGSCDRAFGKAGWNVRIVPSCVFEAFCRGFGRKGSRVLRLAAEEIKKEANPSRITLFTRYLILNYSETTSKGISTATSLCSFKVAL